jgi:hypothetical protein
MKYLFLMLLLPMVAKAMRADLSGNVEAQTRESINNPEAKDDLFQDWNKEKFHQLYGNLAGKVEFENNSFIDTNWFVRYTSSELYRNEYAATQIFTFPRRLVARDVFKLQHKDQTKSDTTESVLNKFFYEWDTDDLTIIVGRFYINYGQGEIFNPINPFNQPTGLTSIQQVAQGNDGGEARFYLNEKHILEFYLLGDKRIENYDGRIDRTVWVHGEYQATDKLQLDYLGGQDQNRNKVGGQLSYRMAEAMIFAQTLFQTKFVNEEPSHDLWDVLLGYDEQFTNKWHFRFEGGHQKRNRFENLQAINFSDRFLPSEYFAAIANTYEVHPLVKLSATLINDIKTGFNYGIAKATFDLGYNLEAEIFGFSPIGKGGSTDRPEQKLVTTDAGAALRGFF